MEAERLLYMFAMILPVFGLARLVWERKLEVFNGIWMRRGKAGNKTAFWRAVHANPICTGCIFH